MKLHYFEQSQADADDTWLQICIKQGYVPRTCLLGGQVVLRAVQACQDPCVGCACPRARCKGRPETPILPELAQPKPEAERRVWGSAAEKGEAQRRRGANWAFYFLGVDPAPSRTSKADDGALAAGRAMPRPGISEPTSNLSDWVFQYVWAYRLRGATARQWSGFIHLKHRHFGFSGICMDAQGGGTWVNDELILPRQLINGVETDVIPIASHEDLERTGPNVQLLLTMYRRRDPGIQHMWPHLAGDDNLYEAMHLVFQEAVTYATVQWPKPFNARPRSETEGWTDEKRWALRTLDAARSQLVDIQVATAADGTYALTGHSAKQFSAAGKKDLAYACIYAYVRFLVWLKMGELEYAQPGGQECSFYVMK